MQLLLPSTEFVIVKRSSLCYSGKELHVYQQNALFQNDLFTNLVVSVKIYGECTYMFYDKENFEGNSFVFETAGNYGGYKPMSISMLSGRAFPPKGTDAICLFEKSSYDGRMMVLHSSQDNIPDNEPISSVVVIQGSWTCYELINYGGQSKTFGVGYMYVNLWQLGNFKIRSITKNCTKVNRNTLL